VWGPVRYTYTRARGSRIVRSRLAYDNDGGYSPRVICCPAEHYLEKQNVRQLYASSPVKETEPRSANLKAMTNGIPHTVVHSVNSSECDCMEPLVRSVSRPVRSADCITSHPCCTPLTPLSCRQVIMHLAIVVHPRHPSLSRRELRPHLSPTFPLPSPHLHSRNQIPPPPSPLSPPQKLPTQSLISPSSPIQ